MHDASNFTSPVATLNADWFAVPVIDTKSPLTCDAEFEILNAPPPAALGFIVTSPLNETSLLKDTSELKTTTSELNWTSLFCKNVTSSLKDTSPLNPISPVPVINVLAPDIVIFFPEAIVTSPLRSTSPVPVVNVLAPDIVMSLPEAIVTSPLSATSPVPVVNLPLPVIVTSLLNETSPLKDASPPTAKLLLNDTSPAETCNADWFAVPAIDTKSPLNWVAVFEILNAPPLDLPGLITILFTSIPLTSNEKVELLNFKSLLKDVVVFAVWKGIWL